MLQAAVCPSGNPSQVPRSGMQLASMLVSNVSSAAMLCRLTCTLLTFVAHAAQMGWALPSGRIHRQPAASHCHCFEPILQLRLLCSQLLPQCC